MKKYIFTLATLLLLALSSVKAQDVTITSMPVTAEPGQVVTVDIKVENWTDIVSAQWSMHWDDEVLAYEGITNWALPGVSEIRFGTPPTTGDNTLTFAWDDETLVGVSLEDNSTLFSIQFTAVGSSGSSTTLMFDGMPTAIEVLNPNLSELDVEFNVGDVIIDPGTAVQTIQTNEFALHANSPNPFKTETNIIFDLHQKSATTLAVYTVTGQLIFEKTYELNAGAQSITLHSGIFPAAGNYVYRLTTEGATAARKLTLVD